MKKVLLGCLALLMSLQFGVTAEASPSFIVTEDGMVSIKSPIGDDVYSAGGTVVVDQPVQGDLIVAGGTIEVNANVSGDIWVTGGTVIIRGNVGDDIRMAGGQVNLYGTVNDDVLAGSGSLVIGKEAVIKGDLIAGTGDLSLDGKVLGNLKTDAGTVNIKGIVTGNAEIKVSENISFTTGAKINGTLQYWAPTESAEFTKYAAKVEYHKFVAKDWGKGDVWKGILGISFGMLFWKWIGMLIIGGLLLVLLPKFLLKTTQPAKTKIWETLWHGLLLLVVIPALALLAAITIIGLPLAGVLVLIYGLLLIFGGINGAYFVGRLLLPKDDSALRQFGALALGTLIFVLIDTIPVIGGLIRWVILLIGLGGLYREKTRLIEDYK